NATYIPFLNDQFQYQTTFEYFDQRNNYRMPAYHRMDVGCNFHKQKKHGIRTWNLSIYNVYSRQNAFFLYFDASSQSEYKQTGKSAKLNQLSLFPLIPSISYGYKF
ncbi:MAG TPA: TonB-dependent receptor, partial [Prolixibacteraceae bacterium]